LQSKSRLKAHHKEVTLNTSSHTLPLAHKQHKNYAKHKAYIAAGYQGIHTSFLQNQNNRKTNPKYFQTSECSSSRNKFNAAEYKLQIRVCSSSIHNT